MTSNELHARLDALAGKIESAKTELETRHGWNDGHRLSAGELEARYRFLKSQLDEEVSSLEAHGEHVSNLEVSVRKWLDGLSLGSE